MKNNFLLRNSRQIELKRQEIANHSAKWMLSHPKESEQLFWDVDLLKEHRFHELNKEKWWEFNQSWPSFQVDDFSVVKETEHLADITAE